jgi:hypothetical protein
LWRKKLDSRSDKKEKAQIQMHTLHITSDEPRQRCPSLFSKKEKLDPTKIIQELYSKFLKDDPLFHYFFEPDLIVRISSNQVLEKIKNHLDKEQIAFIIYDYPVPVQRTDRYCYGESPGPVLERLDVYLPLFHLHALAALTMSPDHHFAYMERSTHTMCNMAGQSRQQEAENLVLLAERKATEPLNFSNGP